MSKSFQDLCTGIFHGFKVNVTEAEVRAAKKLNDENFLNTMGNHANFFSHLIVETKSSQLYKFDNIFFSKVQCLKSLWPLAFHSFQKACKVFMFHNST